MPVPGPASRPSRRTRSSPPSAKVDTDFLRHCGLELDERGEGGPAATLETTVPGVFIGGDAWRGPSTVVESIADGRTAAEVILGREVAPFPLPENRPRGLRAEHHLPAGTAAAGRGARGPCRRRRGPGRGRALPAVRLRLRQVVEVCPNRANVALDVSGDAGTSRRGDLFQRRHVGGRHDTPAECRAPSAGAGRHAAASRRCGARACPAALPPRPIVLPRATLY